MENNSTKWTNVVLINLKKHEVNVAILSQKQGAVSSGHLGDTTQEVWRHFLVSFLFFCCFFYYT